MTIDKAPPPLTLHDAVCQAVALMNGELQEGGNQEAHNILRVALVDYADRAVPDSEIHAISERLLISQHFINDSAAPPELIATVYDADRLLALFDELRAEQQRMRQQYFILEKNRTEVVKELSTLRAENERLKQDEIEGESCEECEMRINDGEGTFIICGRCWNTQSQKLTSLRQRDAERREFWSEVYAQLDTTCMLLCTGCAVQLPFKNGEHKPTNEQAASGYIAMFCRVPEAIKILARARTMEDKDSG